MVHSTLTWKPGLKNELIKGPRTTECECHEKARWIDASEENKTAEIPDFAVVFEKKSSGISGCRAQMIVLAIKTKVEDVNYLKTLMRKAFKQ